MPAGRKPLPTALKELHGNPGKRALNKNEPKFEGELSCPKWLNRLAKEEWKRIVGVIGDIGLLKASDQMALASYCQWYARWRQAEDEIEREGITTRVYKTNKAGDLILVEGEPVIEIRRHPASIAAKDASVMMHKAAALFGLDPSSRSRIQVPEKPKDGKNEGNLDDYIFGGVEDASVDPQVH